MAPASAAQLLFILLTVILIVSGTPVLSLLISPLTNEDGDFVGKGPAVSVGDRGQGPVELPEPTDVSLFVSLSLLQEFARGARTDSPMNARPFFKKCFLSIKKIDLGSEILKHKASCSIVLHRAYIDKPFLCTG